MNIEHNKNIVSLVRGSMLSCPLQSPLIPTSDWHSRGYLPHWEVGCEPQAICFRLGDSLPRTVRNRWEEELADLPETAQFIGRRKRIEAALDAGYGDAFLDDAGIGAMVEASFLHFDGERYCLHAWCVMPNHVHLLVTPLRGNALSRLVHGWKSFTARRINAARGSTGTVWATEYFDRKIRNERHFEDARFYIEQNPVKAGLCDHAEAWCFSSAKRKAPAPG